LKLTLFYLAYTIQQKSANSQLFPNFFFKKCKNFNILKPSLHSRGFYPNNIIKFQTFYKISFMLAQYNIKLREPLKISFSGESERKIGLTRLRGEIPAGVAIATTRTISARKRSQPILQPLKAKRNF